MFLNMEVILLLTAFKRGRYTGELSEDHIYKFGNNVCVLTEE